MTMPTVYLSRRNLLTLLSKLDRNASDPDASSATILKRDNEHATYPQSHDLIVVTAVEDAVYYVDRQPGPVHPLDERNINESDNVEESQDDILLELSEEDQYLAVLGWVIRNLSDVSKQIFDESIDGKGVQKALYNAIMNEQINYALSQLVLDLERGKELPNE